jgi:hypothetical protein
MRCESRNALPTKLEYAKHFLAMEFAIRMENRLMFSADNSCDKRMACRRS